MTQSRPISVERVDPTTAYALAVVRGELVAGPYVRAACLRHLRDLVEEEERGIYFDPASAARVFGFFEDVLKLSEGQFENRPFVLHCSQKFILGSIFGWKNAETMKRRFRRAYIEQGKGNGKSPLAGGIGLYGLVADSEAGAQVYAAGSKKEQAEILFADAVKMVHKSPALDGRVTVIGGTKPWNLAYEKNGSFFRPISKEAGKSGSGPRPHFALCDEVHEHPNRQTMELLERGFKFREQPLLLMITNSGSDRNSVCWEEHEHARQVVEGIIEDDTTFSYVCALDEGDDPLTDQTCWKKANPLYQTILTRDYLAGIAKQAAQIPGKLNGILRLHFCKWTDAEKAWLGRAMIEACEDASLDLDQFKGARCWLSLDIGATNDIAGMSYVFEDGVTSDGRPKFALFSRGFTPKDTIVERALRDKADYETWARQGFLIATPGKKVRLDYIVRSIAEARQRFSVVGLCYDRWLYRDFAEAMDEEGLSIETVEHPQGLSHRQGTDLWMPGSIEKAEQVIMDGRVRIEVSPALRSALSSVALYESAAGLKRFDKQKATNRIDLAVSSAMAIGYASGADGGGSPYESRGIASV